MEYYFQARMDRFECRIGCPDTECCTSGLEGAELVELEG